MTGIFYQHSVNPSLSHTAIFHDDGLNRLYEAQATGNSTYFLDFAYDRYGNMTCVINGNTQGYCPQLSFNGSTNRISNWTYDAAGDVTRGAVCNYTWDGENRLTALSACTTESGTYGAFGRKVEWIDNGAREDFLYDPLGQRVGKYMGSGWAYDYLPLGTGNVAKYGGSETMFIQHNALGSATFVTGHSGTVLQDQLLYPWGQSWQVQGSAVDGTFAGLWPLDTYGSFTTPNRDYVPSYGRWLSADPLGGDISKKVSLRQNL